MVVDGGEFSWFMLAAMLFECADISHRSMEQSSVNSKSLPMEKRLGRSELVAVPDIESFGVRAFETLSVDEEAGTADMSKVWPFMFCGYAKRKKGTC